MLTALAVFYGKCRHAEMGKGLLSWPTPRKMQAWQDWLAQRADVKFPSKGYRNPYQLVSKTGRDDGAVDETRTRDLHLGKVALYQLSYYRKTMGDRRRRGKQALMKTGAGEETRTHTPVAPDPKSGASAIPPRPHAVMTRMALRLPTPKSGRLFIIL